MFGRVRAVANVYQRKRGMMTATRDAVSHEHLRLRGGFLPLPILVHLDMKRVGKTTLVVGGESNI